MSYIDGFLAAVPTARKDEYVAFARKAVGLFKEGGALEVVECWGDDVPEGKLNSMHTAVLREPDETVVFSYIVWPSKAERDACYAKMEKDGGAQMGEMPFDGKRMIFGGFEKLDM